jgi:hypothetical protein
MKKIILWIVIGLGFVLVVGLVAAFLSVDSIVKSGFNSVGPGLTKVETRLASANISPFSGGGKLSGLFIGNPSGYKTPSSIEVAEIQVAVQIGSLFSDKVVIEQVRLKAVDITFEGGLTGNNLDKILANIQESAGGGKDSKQSSSEAKGQKKLQVNDLLIEGGNIRVNLTGLVEKSLTVPLPEIHLQNLGAGAQGITAAELAAKVMDKLLAAVLDAVKGQATGLAAGLKDGGKSAAGQLGNTAKGLKDVFK